MLKGALGRKDLLLVLILIVGTAGTSVGQAFAMGDAPSTCSNRYDAKFTSFVISNGTDTFDAMAHPGVTFDVNLHDNYSVSFVLHTSDMSTNNNTNLGTTWYDDLAFAFGDGHCVPSRSDASIGPNQDVPVDRVIGHPATFSPYMEMNQSVDFTTFGNQVSYSVRWIVPPAMPQNLAATASSQKQIDLSWAAPAQDGGAAITGYNVYRGIVPGGEGQTPIASGITSTSYSDDTVAGNQTYYYYVTAVNTAGESPRSNEANATASRQVDSGNSTLAVASQDSYGNALSGYHTKLYASNGTQIDSRFTPNNFTLNNGENYTIHIQRYSDDYKYKFDRWSDTGSTSVNRTISITSDSSITAIYDTIPTHPTNLTATASSSSQIDLSWDAPASDGGSPVTAYRIQSSLDGSTWTTIVKNTGNTSTTYSDTGLDPNTTHYYRVFALNSVGSSYRSNVASATTPLLSVAGTNVGSASATIP